MRSNRVAACAENRQNDSCERVGLVVNTGREHQSACTGAPRARIAVLIGTLLFGPGQVATLFAQDGELAGDEPLGYPLDASGLPMVPEVRPPGFEAREGDPVEVYFRGRDPMRATFLRRTDETLTVRIGGVETTWPDRSIERVVVMIPASERAAMMRGQIDDRDLTARVRLAEWMRVEGLFDESAGELRGVLELEPSHGRASRLLGVVESLIAARDALRQPREEPEPVVRRDVRAPVAAREKVPVLTDDQINLLRVYEIDLTNPPAIHIGPETVDRLMDAYKESPFIPSTERGREEFRKLPEWKILDIMFRLRARELYGEVRVDGDPETFVRFRDDVQTRWLVNACARCHSGTDAGAFRLVKDRAGGAEAVYTNFLIVNEFVLSDGRPLVNEADPEASALFEMGLPRTEAASGHPDVRGWRPVFRNRRDRGFRAGIEWVRSLYRPRPEYPIEYDPSGGGEPEGAEASNGGGGP